MVKKSSAAPSRGSKKERGGKKSKWQRVALTDAAPRESDVLSLVDKDDREDPSQRLMRGGRFY